MVLWEHYVPIISWISPEQTPGSKHSGVFLLGFFCITKNVMFSFAVCVSPLHYYSCPLQIRDKKLCWICFRKQMLLLEYSLASFQLVVFVILLSVNYHILVSGKIKGMMQLSTTLYSHIFRANTHKFESQLHFIQSLSKQLQAFLNQTP